MWQIKYQNEFLDIEPKQNPEVERNSPLFLVDNLLQEVSTPFGLKYSDKNSRLIGHYFFELTKKTRKKIEVEVFMHGSYKCNATMIIESAGMNRNFTGLASASGYLLFGVSNFFATIKDKKLSDLDLGGERIFDYTTDDATDETDGYWQHFQATYAFEHDYIMLPYKNLAFTDADIEFRNTNEWGNKFDGDKIVAGQPVVPWPKLSYVLTQLFTEHGWKLDTSGINDADWQRLLLYSNHVIPTCDFTLAGDDIVPTPKSSVIIDLRKAMPPDAMCSTFLFEICKRYLWAPVFNLSTNTCRLIALKDQANKPIKDWTKYASPVSSSEFSKEEKVFAFKNTFSDEDQYPSAPDLKQWSSIGFSATKELLLPPDYLNDNTLIFVFLENQWYRNVFNTDTHESSYELVADNIYDEDPGNATDTIETAVTTLPITKVMLENSMFGFFPIVNQVKNSKWGIRTVLYHGMVSQVDGDGSPVEYDYPYGSCTNTPPGQTPQLAWSNVYRQSNFIKDFGIIDYWAKKWLQLVKHPEDITRRFFLPLHELIKFKWDDNILINNIPYLIVSFVQPLSFTYWNFIEAKLQRLSLVANPEDVIEETPDTEYDYRLLLSNTAYSYVALWYIKGDAGATVTCKVIELTESDTAFYFKVNDAEKFLNDEFTVTLDGSGTGFYNVKIGGVTIPYKAMLVRVQIIATTSGTIGDNDIAQDHKITG